MTVVRLDRLGRSLSHMLATIEELQRRGIALRSLRDGIDFSTPAGRLQAAVFAAIAQYERDLLREWLAEARTTHEAKGGRWGRPAALTTEQAATAHRMREAGVDITAIAKTFGVSRATACRYSAPLALSRPGYAGHQVVHLPGSLLGSTRAARPPQQGAS